MPTLYLNFFIGLVVSFLGTLPLGLLNITVMDVSLKKGIHSAIRFALACAMVEFVYSYISVQLTRSLIDFPVIRPITEAVATITLLGMGIHYIRKQNSMADSRQKSVSSFYLGTLLSILNVVAFPFWILYTTLLQGKGLIGISENGSILIYVCGISLGTLGGLLPFIYGSRFLTRWVAAHQHRMDRIIGLLFIFLAVCQFVSIWA